MATSDPQRRKPNRFAAKDTKARFLKLRPPDIVAQVKGQDKYTLLYFPASQLAKVEAKWGKENLIFLKNAPKKRRKNS